MSDEAFIATLLRKLTRGKHLQKAQYDELIRDGYLQALDETGGHTLTTKATELLERT